MLIDVIELPLFYNEYDSALSTMLPCCTYVDMMYDVKCYGRNISLSKFTSGELHRYKTIEQSGDDIVERIFICNEALDLTKSWWTSPCKIYPIQMKSFSHANPIIGCTFKYVNGITELLEEHFAQNTLTPTYLARSDVRDVDVCARSPYNLIIPSVDTRVFEPEFAVDPHISVQGIDRWANSNNRICDLKDLRSPEYPLHLGALIADTVVPPVDETDLFIDTNPINKSWKLYELLMQMSDLAVSDIRIDVSDMSTSVSFGSRYTGFFDYSHFPDYQSVTVRLARMARDAIKERYGEDPWIRVVIEKVWTEGIFITVHMTCEHRSSPIEIHAYVDIPTFLLGTVGLT